MTLVAANVSSTSTRKSLTQTHIITDQAAVEIIGGNSGGCGIAVGAVGAVIALGVSGATVGLGAALAISAVIHAGVIICAT